MRTILKTTKQLLLKNGLKNRRYKNSKKNATRLYEKIEDCDAFTEALKKKAA